MGMYPKQDFYYGFLARYTGDSDNRRQIWDFFDEMQDNTLENREIGFTEAGDHGKEPLPRGVVGVKINDPYGPGEKVVENIPDKRDEYATDMSYLGGYHTGEFDLQAFEREKNRAKNKFEELNLEEKLKDCEFIELLTAQPSTVTVSWHG